MAARLASATEEAATAEVHPTVAAGKFAADDFPWVGYRRRRDEYTST
jgi:hypothetical protein